MPHTPDRAAESDVDAQLRAFGQRLRELRTGAGLKQAELAQSAGLDRAFYVGVEGGSRNISIRNVFMLAAALDVEAAELFRPPSHPPRAEGS